MKRWNPLTLLLAASLLAACAPAAPAPTAAVQPIPAGGQRAASSLNEQPAPTEALAASPPASCPVTQPPDPAFVPPAPYSPTAYSGMFWYGTPALWTALPDSGAWEALPHDAAGYSQKLVFWRDGYNWQAEPLPKLGVSGRRLDAPAPHLPASRATNGFNADPQSLSFMLVGGNFPTAGCWEVMGLYSGTRLSYVVWIVP